MQNQKQIMDQINELEQKLAKQQRTDVKYGGVSNGNWEVANTNRELIEMNQKMQTIIQRKTIVSK